MDHKNKLKGESKLFSIKLFYSEHSYLIPFNSKHLNIRTHITLIKHSKHQWRNPNHHRNK